MGRDIPTAAFFGFTDVSIHAPAWGATPSKTAKLVKTVVSIHAPAWGAT